jgi:hypothetical protein
MLFVHIKQLQSELTLYSLCFSLLYNPEISIGFACVGLKSNIAFETASNYYFPFITFCHSLTGTAWFNCSRWPSPRCNTSPQRHLQFYHLLQHHLPSPMSLLYHLLVSLMLLNHLFTFLFYYYFSFRYRHNRIMEIMKLYIIYLIPKFLALCMFNITDLILLHSLIFHR